jgi:hypothetical protein
MSLPRRRLAPALAVLALAGGALSGCGSGEEDSAAVALAKSGLLGGLGEQLKHEDDEAEVAELQANAPQTPQERMEAREAAEEATVQAAQPAESAGQEPEEGSS